MRICFIAARQRETNIIDNTVSHKELINHSTCATAMPIEQTFEVIQITIVDLKG
jgi:hypothetical protein